MAGVRGGRTGADFGGEAELAVAEELVRGLPQAAAAEGGGEGHVGPRRFLVERRILKLVEEAAAR